MIKNVLITGAKGQLGSELGELYAQYSAFNFIPTDVDTLDFPGSTVSEAPAPLLANFGIVNVLGYTADLNVSVF